MSRWRSNPRSVGRWSLAYAFSASPENVESTPSLPGTQRQLLRNDVGALAPEGRVGRRLSETLGQTASMSPHQRAPNSRAGRGLVETYELLAMGEDDEDHPGRGTLCRRCGLVLLNSWCFQGLTAILIVFNALVIGFETDDVEWILSWDAVEQVLWVFFTIELCLRLSVLSVTRFFSPHSPDFVWNMFDLIIVAIGVVDLICEYLLQGAEEMGWYSLMLRTIRLLRILRIFRLIRFLKRLFILAYGFMLAAVAVFWVAFLMAVVLYFCAIILVRTLGRLPPENEDQEFFHTRFGSISQAMFTLFQMAVQPDLRSYKDQMDKRPCLALFLVIFVIFGSFGMIALLTGVISEAMFEKNIMRLEDQRTERELMRKNIVQCCTEMFDEIDRDSNDEATRPDVVRLLPRIANMFDDNNVPYTRHDLATMVDLMDTDASGGICRAEFCRGILQVAEEVRPMLVMELHCDSMSYFKNKMEEVQEHLKETLESQVQAVERAEEFQRLRHVIAEGFLELRKEVAELTFSKSQAQRHALQAPPPAPAAYSVVPPTPSSVARGGPAATSSSASAAPAAAAAAVAPPSVGELEQLVRQLVGEVRELQGSIFSLSGRVEEIVSDATGERVASRVAELAAKRRQMELELGMQSMALSPTSAPLAAPLRSSLAPGAPAAPKLLNAEVAPVMESLRRDVQAVQGGLFSLGARMEELVSDAHNDRMRNMMEELSSLRQRRDGEAAVTARVGQCEYALVQATSVLKQLEERTKELVGQVQSLEDVHRRMIDNSCNNTTSTRAPTTPVVLSRSHSLNTSEDRSRLGAWSRSEDRGSFGPGVHRNDSSLHRGMSDRSFSGGLHLTSVAEVASRSTTGVSSS